MPKRATIATRDYLKQVPLPTHATSYTVITHETVINNALEQLKLKGFSVVDEKYRTNSSGEVAIGVYQLNYKDDPELGMMFAWANSYDKSMRFKCAVGGFVRTNEACIISGDFSWGRKHTGTADQEMIGQVNNQIMNAQTYYDNIVAVKEKMKTISVPKEDMANFLGECFFIKNLFSKEQIGIVRDEMQVENLDTESLWSYYNHMLVGLKKAHPRTWMDEHRNLHNYVCDAFNIQVLPEIEEGPKPYLTTTVTNTEPVAIEAKKDDGPVSIYQEAPVENIEQLAEVKQDSEFHMTINTPDSPVIGESEEEEEDEQEKENAQVDEEKALERANPDTYEKSAETSDVSPDEQARIDATIRAFEKIEVKAPTLTLPD